MNKKSQRIFAGVLAVLVSMAMIGSALIGYFIGGDTPSTNPAANNTANAEAEYQDQKLRIDAMVQQAKANPDNVQLQTALGNEYYDAAIKAQVAAPNEMQANFKKAVEAYQQVLKTNKDPNIMVDMATAAFYSGDYDLAEKSYNEALVLKPDLIYALFNYGIFLSQTKQDWSGALKQWQKALPLARNDQEKDEIQAMINMAQSQLQAKTTDGVANPNLKNGE